MWVIVPTTILGGLLVAIVGMFVGDYFCNRRKRYKILMQLATGEPITWALQVAQSNGSLVAEDIFLLNQLIKKGHVDEHPADNCVESAKTSDEPEQLYSITWSGRTEFRRLGAGKKVKRC